MSSSLQYFLLAFSLFSISQAAVPASKTFKFVNEGEFGDYIVEYGANYRVLDIYTFPFQLCFFNTTPNNYSLGLRMGTVRSESQMRWVWEANRNNPVGENATFSLEQNGNLVLAEANGHVVWQTNTSNKGVVGFKLLPNGNMVLHDSKGKFIWQSFKEPTDTLLVGQELHINGPTYLTSRPYTSSGHYSYFLHLEFQRLVLWNFNNTENTGPKVVVNVGDGMIEYMRFISNRKTNALRFEYKSNKYTTIKTSTYGARTLSRPKFNTTLTYFRLDTDGNLKAYTYDTRKEAGSWKVTYALYK
ncbi:hypothetical protein M9H77_21718 [Catharanthus roseus]|uniref:Uncharacterized protein n=1 Tax=Catharanthus roseus TaxID=4058 RepID=A0ACC0AND0_CATRO|nr:hypothetical protein M9H77_21718 [Catharanthus roseus]